jgi:hypothetical protein
LVQISSVWNSREGAPLGRNRYLELQIKKARTNDERAKLSAFQKPCDKMTEAIVTDGGNRGHIVKLCPDPACRVHRPDAPSPEQVERERAAERKRIQKEKLAITTRHRILATTLQQVSAPLKKADLQAIAQYLVACLSYNQVPALAKRHKVEVKKDSDSAQELLAKQVPTYDESELGKLLFEISLLDLGISDSLQAATTFSWTPPNATEWTLRRSRNQWQRSLPQNETRKQLSRRLARRQPAESIRS